jgi:hypothetical protein
MYCLLPVTAYCAQILGQSHFIVSNLEEFTRQEVNRCGVFFVEGLLAEAKKLCQLCL